MRGVVTHRSIPSGQSGLVLLEAMIGIVFFSLGIIGLIGLQAMSVRHVTQSKIRADATYHANQLIGQMWLDRANLASYAHNPNGPACNPTSAASANANVTAWLTNVTSTSVAGSLPGATTAMQQIIVTPASNNAVSLSICWRTPGDADVHKYTITANVN